jgi:hypothetical protein
MAQIRPMKGKTFWPKGQSRGPTVSSSSISPFPPDTIGQDRIGRNKRVSCLCAVQLATKLKNPPRGGQLETNERPFFCDIQIRQDFTCHTRCQFVIACRGPVQLNNRAGPQSAPLLFLFGFKPFNLSQ